MAKKTKSSKVKSTSVSISKKVMTKKPVIKTQKKTTASKEISNKSQKIIKKIQTPKKSAPKITKSKPVAKASKKAVNTAKKPSPSSKPKVKPELSAFQFANPLDGNFKGNPELPDLEELSKIADDQVMPSLPSMADPLSLEDIPVPNNDDSPIDPATAYPITQKKSIWTKLFGSKKQILPELPKAEPTKDDIEKCPLPVPEQIEISADSLDGTEEKTEQNDDLQSLFALNDTKARDQASFENQKRVTDNENRERLQHLREMEAELNIRKTSIEEKEQDVEIREKAVLEKEKEYNEIDKLREEVENQQISLQYQKQRISELNSELALKDAMLRDKEKELSRREQEIKVAEEIKKSDLLLKAQNQELQEEVKEEDDAILYLQSEIDRQRKEFERQLKQLNIASLEETDRFSGIHQDITQCYLELSQKNTSAVKNIYSGIKAKYADLKQYDKNAAVYKEIVTLFEDIKKKI